MFFLEGTKLRAVLIREGTSVNKNRWTRAVLEQIAKVSEGVPIHFYDMSKKADASFSHHWEALRTKMPPGIQRLLPEKLPGSQVGVVRNPSVVTGKDGKAEIVSDIETEGGWFTGLVESLLSRGKKLGLSIFVPERGIKFHDHSDGSREPTEVTEVVSFDAVSFPSAGGQLLPALEALGQPQEEDRMKWKNLIKRLRSLVPKDKQAAFGKLKAPDASLETVPALLESDNEWVDSLLEIRGHKVTGDARTPFLEALLSTTDEDPKDDPAPDPGNVKRTGNDGDGNANAGDSTLEADAVTREEFTTLSATLQGVVKTNSYSLLEAVIGASKLPKALADFTRQQFKSVIESAGVIEKAAVDTFITGLKKGLGDSQNPTLESIEVQQSQVSSGEEFLAAYRALFLKQKFAFVGEGDKKRKIPAYSSIRRAYADLTGDIHCDGREYYMKRRGRRTPLMESIDMESMGTYQALRAFGGVLEETITTAMFPVITSENLHQATIRDYNQQDFLWRLVASPEPVTDFKTWRWNRIGEFPNLPAVAEGATYANDWAQRGPDEEEITLAISKRGGQFAITWENIVDDMTRRFQSYPNKIARAAMRTLNDHVFEWIVDNAANIYDATVLGTAGHNNLLAAAYSFANAKTLRRDMRKQVDVGWAANTTGANQGGLESNRVKARRMFCGNDLYDQVYEDLFTDGKPDLASTRTGEIGTAGMADQSLVTAANSPRMPNVLRSKWGIELADALQYIDDNDADMYFMAADPDVVDMMFVGFFRGRQEPELFVQDMQNVGSFFDNDVITHKVRHIYQAEIADYRGFQLGIP